MGRATSRPHEDLGAEISHSMPTVSIDYMFLGIEESEERGPDRCRRSTRIEAQSQQSRAQEGRSPANRRTLGSRYPRMGHPTVRLQVRPGALDPSIEI